MQSAWLSLLPLCTFFSLFSWYSKAINQVLGTIKPGQGGPSSTCLCTADLPLPGAIKINYLDFSISEISTFGVLWSHFCPPG